MFDSQHSGEIYMIVQGEGESSLEQCKSFFTRSKIHEGNGYNLNLDLLR